MADRLLLPCSASRPSQLTVKLGEMTPWAGYNKRMAKKKGRKAWLVTWEWQGDHAAVEASDVVAAILKPQTGPENVKRAVELLYAAREYAAVDKLGSLTHNPYPAEFGTIPVEMRLADGEVVKQKVAYQNEIYCGHNPHLYARHVENLREKDAANPAAGLVWDEIPRPTVRLDD